MLRPFLRPIGTLRLVVDIVAAVVLLLLTGFIGGGPSTSAAPVLVTAVLMAGALAVRRLSPALALAIAWVGALAQISLGLPPLPSNVAIFGVLYVTAAYGTRAVMWAGLASAGLGALVITVYLLAIDWFYGPGGIIEKILFTALPVFLAALFGLALSWTAGALVRALRRAQENRDAQRLAEERAEAEHERGRIARDMHDVVAHSLAVVVAQADGARYAAAADPALATEALTTIGRTARAALSDVRMLLGQLRHREAEGPQPTLADIDPLLAQVRAAGVELVVDIDPAPQGEPPAAVQLAVFRILQEALTNALRHGDGGAVEVAMSWWPGAVSLTVRNGAVERDVRQSAPGHGIIGMRERAQLAGGSLDVELVDGRFRVRAEIPWKDDADVR